MITQYECSLFKQKDKHFYTAKALINSFVTWRALIGKSLKNWTETYQVLMVWMPSLLNLDQFIGL